MIVKRSLVVMLLVAALVFVGAGTAFAVVRINVWYPQGVGGAKLGILDYGYKGLTWWFGRPTAKGVDRDYPGQTVYYYVFGRKLANGKYPLEVNSNKYHRVFAFTCNTSNYDTAKGVHVGVTESFLKKQYGSALRRYPTRVYTRYALGGRSGTDFYCRYVSRAVGYRVVQIIVRSY